MWSSDFSEIVDLPVGGHFGVPSQKSLPKDFIFTGLLPCCLRLNLLDCSKDSKTRYWWSGYDLTRQDLHLLNITT